MKDLKMTSYAANCASNGALRARLSEIVTERSKIATVLTARFPDYVALSMPQSLTPKELQSLLTDDEAVVALDIGDKSYAWVAKALNAPANDIHTGLEATETAVKQAALDQYRIVYFATHALVAGDLRAFAQSKAEPALVLSIPDEPTDQDDGLLQASEVSELKLNADWAVLSACNTAASDGVGAEALSGLARAFLYAGARSLVVSHWDVLDDETALLISDLFKRSSQNKSLSHGEALQQAQLNMLNNAKNDEDAHPRVWAPFVVVGEPAKLK